MMNPTESCKSGSPENPSRQTSDDESDSLAVNPDCGIAESLVTDLTESCAPLVISEIPSSQTSGDESDSLAVNRDCDTAEALVIDLTGSCEPVVTSEIPSSQTKDDGNQACRAASLLMNST